MTIRETKTDRVGVLDNVGNTSDGITSTNASAHGFRVYQLSNTQTFWTNVGSTNALIVQPALATQGGIVSFSDGSQDIGSVSGRYRDVYQRRSFVKDHSAFTGSELVQTTAALQTVGAATNTLWTSPALLDNSSHWVEVWVTVRDTASGSRAMYQRQACIFRQAGGAATILTGVLAPVTVESVAGWDADIDVTGNTFRVRVTSTALTLNWAASIRYQAVSGNT